jgi:hypothetical protein
MGYASIRGIGFQGSDQWKVLERFVGPPWKPRPMTRLEKQRRIARASMSSPPVPVIKSLDSTAVHNRWLRRRYQELLGRTPLLTFSGPVSGNALSGVYSVSLSPSAINNSHRYSVQRRGQAGSGDLAWMEYAEASSKINSVQKDNKSI